MAIFASTTTSGYSDPMKAMNIKALEQRLKDQQAQMAAQQPDAASMATIPGGIGHVLGVVGDRMQQGRQSKHWPRTATCWRRRWQATTRRAARRRQRPSPRWPPLCTRICCRRGRRTAVRPRRSRRKIAGRISIAKVRRKATELTLQTNQATVDATLSGQANQAAMETARLEAAKAAATEAARVQREAKIDEEQRIANRPASDAAKIMQDVQSGKLTQEQGEALVSKLSAPSASEMKAGNELQNTHLDTQSALSDMKEARGLMGPEGAGIRAGTGAGWAQTGAKLGGDKLGLTDPTLTQPTERFNQLMNAEAITAMAAKLKGASTDYEMRQFVALMNDPNAEPKTKMQALDKMIAKAEAHLSLQQEQLKRAKVSAPGGGGGAAVSGGGAQDALGGSVRRGRRALHG